MTKAWIACSVTLLFLGGCTSKETANSSKKYFDLQGYFKAESESLQKKSPWVEKSVSKDNNQEKRTVRIRNWTNELSLFTASDINKSAWKDSYRVSEKGNRTEYIASDANLRTRRIIIERDSAGALKLVQINNKVSNSLYTSEEDLSYYPDSLYQIRKKQHVLLLGDEDYLIEGKVK